MKTRYHKSFMNSKLVYYYLVTVSSCLNMSGDIEPSAKVDVLNSADQEHQLQQAAFHGSLELVTSLLTKDNLNARDAIGRTPLALACWGGHFDVAEYLLKAGADITGQLRQVSTFKQAKIVELLLRYGADVNEQYPDGQRPLHHACERENIDVAEVLLKYGANVNAKDSLGKTALHYAASRGNHFLTLLLLQHNSDVNSPDLHLKTPLHNACRYLPVVRTLLENGANASPFDANGCTPLNMPLEIDVITILLDYGCGADVLCRQPQCLCNRTVSTCCYFKLCAQGDPKLECFERYFTKAHEAKVLSKKNAPASDIGSSWNPNQKDAFRAKCSAELAKMKMTFIGGSTVNYSSVLTHDLSTLRNHPFLCLTPESCRRKFPVYGDMIYSHFLKLKRFLLLEQCSTLFSLTDLPWLPNECVKNVLKYLPNEDLSSAAMLCGKNKT